MSAGELRHKVELQTLSYAATTNGDYSKVGSYSELDTVWASIKYSDGKEDETGRDLSKQNVKIKVRYRTDLDNINRVLFGSRVFDIESAIDPTGRRQYLILNSTYRSN